MRDLVGYRVSGARYPGPVPNAASETLTKYCAFYRKEASSAMESRRGGGGDPATMERSNPIEMTLGARKGMRRQTGYRSFIDLRFEKVLEFSMESG